MRLLRFAPWIVLVVLVAFTAATYPDLPEQIPQRIDSSGTPSAYMAKAPLTWFLLPGIALLTLGLLQGLSALLPSNPGLFNFPEKERLLAVPERYRGPVIEEMRAILDATSVAVVATFSAVQWMLWRSAHGATGVGALVIVLLLSFMILPLILLFLPRLSAATTEAERRWHADDPAAVMAANARGR